MNGVAIDSVNANDTIYQFLGLTASTSYNFGVCAYNANGNSDTVSHGVMTFSDAIIGSTISYDDFEIGMGSWVANGVAV